MPNISFSQKLYTLYTVFLNLNIHTTKDKKNMHTIKAKKKLT